MLAKMGWSSGKGLGKNEDGIQEHVRVKKRTEGLALGARPAGAGSEAALSSAVAEYDALQASLLASYGGSSGSAGAGGRPKRARSSSEASAASEASSEAPRKSGSGGGAAAAAPVRIIGRFAHHRALRQKNVAGYSAADLHAILGTHALGSGGKVGGSGDAVALPSAPLVQRASISVSLKKKKKDKKEKREKKEKKERKEKKEVEAEEAVAEEEEEGEGAAVEESREERERRREARRERKRLKREGRQGSE